MVLFRSLLFLLLAVAAMYFGLYIFTSQERYRRSGLLIAKWTVFAALGFFAVLILERLLAT
ncbi:hypothetical protein [Hydrogenophaga sp.]|uniref:hypothetical protein n=1 Tax=Hydrogenophaga sp. TaxID=1904254 RepID=UPI0035634732